MRVIQCTTRVEMAAEDFWALRMDQNFDAYCARCDDTVTVTAFPCHSLLPRPLRAWATPRILDARLNRLDPSGSSWCGRQRVPNSSI